MLEIYVDGDACPVKQEVYKVAKRYELKVTLVSNSPLRGPTQEWVRRVLVDDQFDAADNWIEAHATKDDVVVTTDIPLASRCIRNGARVVAPTGRVFSEANIGSALATRDLLAELRGAGAMLGGPPPFQKSDRSRFLHALDQIIQAIKRDP